MKRPLLAFAASFSLFAPVQLMKHYSTPVSRIASVSLSRSSGPAWSRVHLTGFVGAGHSSQRGSIMWDGGKSLGVFRVNGAGAINSRFDVPSAQLGHHVLEAIVNGEVTAQHSFQITQAGLRVRPTPPKVQPTTTPAATPVAQRPTATSTIPPAGQSSVTVTVDRSVPSGVSYMSTGVTHDHYSTDSWNDPAAVASGQKLLQASAAYQNQHIYGWGTVNPEPAPGVFDWSSLDDRVKMMRSMGAKMVITLCCAPDWMTSLASDTSNYPNLPPTQQHIADFAQLARAVAERYPDVHYFQVWNEMKGMWDDAANNWDYVGYTNLYNAVYDALKSVNPAIQVGGPYLVIEGTGTNLGDWSQQAPITQRNWTVLNYWLQNKHGADFIALDRTVHDDHDPASYSPSQLMSLTSEFESIANQVRAKTSLPIWWSEDYFVGSSDWNFQAAGLASMMYHELRGGSAVTLAWQPQGVNSSQYGGNNLNLFSDTRYAGGGQPFPYYYAFRDFHSYFSAGTQLYHASSSSPDIEVLASASHALLINTRSTTTSVSVNGTALLLNPYEVRVL